MPLMADRSVVKAHWPLRVVNASGHETGGVKPPHELPEGDLQGLVIEYGPDCPYWAPTSANAWKRSFLDEIMPLPEMEKKFAVGSATRTRTFRCWPLSTGE